ncbi:MAG: DUF1559 domain-containing protein, partial [Gemmataceae bacterium]
GGPTAAPTTAPAGGTAGRQNPTNLLPRATQAVTSWPIGRTLSSSVRMMALESEGGFKPAQFQAVMGFPVEDLSHVLNAWNYKDDWLFTVAQTTKPYNPEHLKTQLRLDPPVKVRGKKSNTERDLFTMRGDFDSLGNLLFKAATPRKDFGVVFVDPTTVAFGNLAVLTSFLEDDAKPQPRPENIPSVNDAPPPSAAGGTPGMGMTGGMPGPGGPGGPMPGPGGPMPGPGGPMPGAAGPGGPPKPNMAVGDGPTGTPAPAAPAAPVFSGSYLTLTKGLKGIMDKIEKIEENRETRKRGPNAIVCFASELAPAMDAAERQMRQQVGTVPPEFGAGKAQLKTVRSVGVAVVAFDQNNANAIVAAEFAQPKDAQLIETAAKNLAVPAVKEWIKKTLKLTVTSPVVTPPMGFGDGSTGPDGEGAIGPGGPASSGSRPIGRGSSSTPPGVGIGLPPTGPGGPGFAGGPGNPGGAEGAEEKGDGTLLVEREDRIVIATLELGLSNEAYTMMAPIASQAILGVKGVSDMASTRSRPHELAAALQAYAKDKNAFPRGTVDRPVTAERGFPWRPDQRLSWAVSLLPYLGPEYREWRLDPTLGWNEKTNLLFARRLVPQLLATSHGLGDPMLSYPGSGDLPVATTNWVGMAGLGLDAAEYDGANKKRGVFGYDRETKKDEVADGLDQTVALILSPGNPKTPWLVGGGATVRAVDEADANPLAAFVCMTYPADPNRKSKWDGQRGTLAIMGDGRLRFLPATLPPETFKAMCTVDGDDRLDLPLDAVAPLVADPGGRTLSTPAVPVRVPDPKPEAPKAAAPPPVVTPMPTPTPPPAPGGK